MGATWTEKHDNFLRDNSNTMSLSDMANVLHRTIGATATRCSKLKIKLYKSVFPDTIEKILSNTHIPAIVFAKELGISVTTINGILHDYNIERDISYVKPLIELKQSCKFRPYRRVMELSIKRRLLPNETIHHIDMNKQNNSIDNLYLCSNSKHHIAHGTLNKAVSELMKRGIIKFTDGEYVIVE